MTNGKDKLIFSAVPRFARFIIDNHLEEYIYKEIAIARAMEIPLWKKFKDLTTEQLAVGSAEYYTNFLEALATNNISENLHSGMEKYRQDLLANVSRDLITPEDFLLTHTARKKALLSFITRYNCDADTMLAIIEEIDVVICHYNVAATYAYVELITKTAQEEKSIKDKLFTTSPGFYYIYDLIEDQQVLLSERLFDTLGYKRYEYAGNNQFFKEIMHPDDLVNATAYFASLSTMKDSEVRFFEYRMRNSNNEYQWMRNYESVYKWTEDQKPAQLLGVALDITKERLFTEEIKLKEEALKEAQLLAHMGAYTWDFKKNKLVGFSGSLSSLGISEGDSFEQLMKNVHPADKEEVLRHFNKAIQGRREFECEYRCIINNREHFLWSRGKVSFLDNEPQFFKATVMDVTDQHQMVRKLQRSEQLYKQAQSLNKIGNWSWHINTDRIQWSDELFRIFGMEPQAEKPTYERFLGFLLGGQSPSKEKVLEDQLMSPGHREYYFKIQAADGKDKILYGQSETIVDNNGAPFKMIGTFQDVTIQKNLEKTLFDRTAQLQKLNDSLKIFSHISSHDLKEPVRKISLFSDRLRMLNEKKLDEQSNNLLQTIIRSSLRLQEMIEEIMSVSKINSDENFEMADLNDILLSTLEEMKREIAGKTATISHDILPQAFVNKRQIRQLFYHLIANALKFSRPDLPPVITFTCDTLNLKEVNEAGLNNTRRYLRIKITDNGIGFQESYSEKIFAMFQRLHDRSAYPGSGIGLALCREIAGNHGGIITASGKPGEGASFAVVIPKKSK